jgi:hypothetical protein
MKTKFGFAVRPVTAAMPADSSINAWPGVIVKLALVFRVTLIVSQNFPQDSLPFVSVFGKKFVPFQLREVQRALRASADRLGLSTL